MKRILVLILSMNAWASFAQESEWLILQGNESFQLEQYSDAIEFYRRGISEQTSTPSILFRLAESYRLTFQYPEAEQYYQRIVEEYNNYYPLASYYLGLVLKYNANYEESTNVLNQFIGNYGSDEKYAKVIQLAKTAIAGNRIASAESLEAKRFKREHLKPPVNSKFNDFAPTIFSENQLLITSGRLSKKRRVDRRFGESFTDIFLFKKSPDGWSATDDKSFRVINTEANDGSGLFNKQKTKYYYTTCNPNCGIYVSLIKDNVLSEPQLLNENINPESTDNKQPSISHGGDTLYFVSNRPGGYGGSDIYFSVDSGEEDWGPVINIGRSINTPGDESSPLATILPNILMFSSNGHIGFGGFDLFMAKRISSGDTLLYNLGEPFNSSKDELLAELGDKQFLWSSNRSESMGNFDIFQTQIPSPLAFLSALSLKTANSSSEIKLSEIVATSNSNNISLTSMEGTITYEDLFYQDQVLADKLYSLKLNGSSTEEIRKQISEEKYQLLLRVVSEKIEEQAALSKTARYDLPDAESKYPEYSLSAVLVDSSLNRPIPNATITLMNSENELIKSSYTNDNGLLRFTNIPNDDGNYLMIKKLSTIVDQPQFRNIEISKYYDNTDQELERIYFDFSSYSLRPEGKKALDDIAAYLKENPESQLEILGYTDNTGSNEYNLLLSAKRAQAVADYLIAMDVDERNLSIVPKGKAKPFKTGIAGIGQQRNRRVQFTITGTHTLFKPSATTYFLTEESTWKQIARETKVSTSELIRLNNISNVDETLRVYSPVRLPKEIVAKDTKLLAR